MTTREPVLSAPTRGLTATEVREHPWCGPADRMPTRYRGPHGLGRDGWVNFVTRLERGEEVAIIRAAVADNRRVLDVGGGTGEIARAVAAQVGRCTTVEPHADRVASLQDSGHGVVDVHPGHAESLPFEDGAFDAVYATWVLPYVDDPERAAREIARVCDASDPGAKVVLIGGSPDNELVSVLNEVCVPLAGEEPDHQGYLLATAAAVFADSGFGRFSLHRTEAALHFPEPSVDERVDAACAVLGDFWYEGHPRVEEMREALRPRVHRHFRHRSHAIGDQATVLVARPGTPS
ncbi:class I SAM-dependent methyltransferase [Saccharothrix sp. BKS2]|uniref:class I SAM-dependent methyltransferase n=1 Tax=Saccharothrix sp. BKS2 TaxID=3064400 RepID=UPI0039E7D121